MAGRPRGAWSDKEFRDAVRKAVHVEDSVGVKKLERIATKLADAAMQGESWAVAEVANRLDGRPAQAIVGGEEGSDPIHLITEIRRVIIRPEHQDG